MEIDKLKLRNIVLDSTIDSGQSRNFKRSFLATSWKAIKKAIPAFGEEDYEKCINIISEFDCFKFDDDGIYFEIVKIPLDYIGISKEKVKNALLEYMKEKETYSISIEEIVFAIEKELFRETNYRGLGSFVLEEVIEILKEFDCFKFDGDKVIRKKTLKDRLQSRCNIIIDTIDDNIEIGIIVATAVVIVGGGIGGCIFGVVEAQEQEQYQNSVLIDSDKEHSMRDVYVVYSTDKVYFCTRKLHKITENDKTYGEFRNGYGEVDEYYYRDEIYDYFDMTTGNKICEDHQDGFYIENLIDIYDSDEMKDRNYKIGIDEVTKDIDNDYLLSRNPGLKRK